MNESANQSSNFNFRLTALLRRQFRQACEASGHTPSEKLRELMYQHVIFTQRLPK